MGAAPSSDIDRQRATVVFVDILGATTLTDRIGIEPAYSIVTGCLRVLDAVARRHGGMIDKYLSDCLMAVFGFPIVSPNPPAAAVRAAVDMLAAAARYATEVQSPLPLMLRIGINTGLMVAGDLRGPVVREFAVMGDAVNVAARLKDIGNPGEIHVGPETHAAACGQFTFEALQPLTLRGKVQRVPAFRVAGAVAGRAAGQARETPLVETPLVGREALLARLRAVMAGPVPRLGYLVGPEGIGKSRLLDEAASAVRARGRRVAWARAVEAQTEVAFGLAADVLASITGGAPGAEPPSLDQLLGGLAAYPPGLVVCDDMQWADAASLHLLAAAVARQPDTDCGWLFAARPNRAAEARLRQALDGRLDVITVPPLDAAEASELLGHVLGSATVSAAARARIAVRAEGNPYRLVLGGLLASAVETEVAHEAETVERASEAERRRVTVLFADITGFTRMSEQLPPADAYRAVSGCLKVLHETATEYGGAVEKYLGDCIMATFGVPIALEDAPRAAINAAIAMRRRVREYNVTAALPSALDIHVGINTGLSVAGDISGPLLREFTLMGDAVSIASKLKDVAPAGSIWVGDETRRATEAAFELQPVPPVAEGGWPGGGAFEVRSEHEQVYRPRIGRGETIFAELVGREREFDTLRGAVAAVVAGRGGVVGVTGDAGLGKSRLFAELAASPEAAAVRWAEGRSVAMGRRLRFHPFVDLLSTLLELRNETAPDPFEAVRTAVARVLGRDPDEVAPYIAMVLGVPLAEAVAEQVAGIRADVLDRLQLRAVRELLLALARRQPLVLFFEDAYWADRSSIECLAQLLRVAAEAPIVFLFAARPGYPETSGYLASMARSTVPADRVAAIDLQPLDAGATHRLLGTLFRHGALPVASRDRIAAHAGGNPLYIEELLRSLIEQGAIETTAEGLRATAAIDAIVVPPTVQEVILARVDRMSPRPKQALQVAAVVGQRMAEPVLAALVGEPAALPATLDALVDAQLLVREVREGTANYTFKHRLIQDVTYESMLESRRVELHRRVGDVIRTQLQGAPGYHGMLAYHYSMGSDLEQAEEHLFLAGADAARAGAPTEALELLQESSRLFLARNPSGGDPVKRVALHKYLAGAYLHRGQLPEANRNLNEALGLLGEASPANQVTVALGVAQTVALVALDLYWRGGGATHRPAATPHDLEVISLMFNRARAQTVADPARFVFDTLATLRKLRLIDPASVPGAGGLYAAAIGVFSYSGISTDMGRRLLEVAERYVDRNNVAETFLCRMMAFVHHWVSGDWDARHEIPDALTEAALRQGQLWDVVTHLGLETFKQVAQGRFVEADRRIDRLEAIDGAYAYDLARSNRRAGLAFLHTERRVLDAALAAAEVYLTEHDEALLNLLALGTKAKVQVLLGDGPGADATLAAADAILAAGRVPPWHYGFIARSHVLRAVADAESARQRRSGVGRWVRNARWAAERFAWLRPETYRAIGQLAWLAGRQRRGLAWLGRSLDAAEQLGMRPEAARTRFEIARRLAETGGGAAFRAQSPELLRQQARTAFADLGLEWDLVATGSD